MKVEISGFVLFLAIVCVSSPGSADSQPKVRVLVAENQKSLKITVQGAYLIRNLPSLKIISKGTGLKGAAFEAVPGGIRLGSWLWETKGLRLEPSDPRDLYVNQSRFRGTLDVVKEADSLNAVNVVGIEDYLYGVLHHEVAPWWPMEALKAQAIAARTYAFYQMRINNALPFDLRSSTASQVYGGSTTERYRTKIAVDQTAGKVLVFQGQPFPAYFHATCAGMTAGAHELWKIRLAPLAGEIRCGFCRISPHYFWHERVSLAHIEELFNKYNRPLGRVLKVELVSRTPSGRVGSLSFTGTLGEAVLAAKDFRVWVGGDRMRSTSFTVNVDEDMAQFHGKGWGHGVGLCQWGALGQALVGRKHDKILQFYYPGSQIVNYESQ